MVANQACGHSHTFLPVSYSGISVNIQDLAPSCAGFLFGEPLAYPYPRYWAVPGGWALGATGGLLMVSLNVLFTGVANTAGALAGKGRL